MKLSEQTSAVPSTVGDAVLWDLDPGTRHLNHGSFGGLPKAVSAEQHRMLALAESNPVRWFSELLNHVEQARSTMASLLGTDEKHLAFVLNASAGATVVFQSLAQQGPVNVMTTNHGYGAITMGAERLAQRTGGISHRAHIPLNATAAVALELVVTALEAARPTLLVIDQVTSATARAFPADQICEAARRLGVLTLVDGAHAPGVLPHPVCTASDYWVGNLHKFVCAPRGSAVLVARGDGQELFPVIDSWGTPFSFPQRFNSQGTFDATPWLTAPFAWQYLEKTIGWDHIREMSTATMDAGAQVVAQALGKFVDDPLPDVGQPVGPMRLLRLPGMLGASIPEADSLRVPFMDASGVVAAFTSFDGSGYIRLSSHAYTTAADFQRMAEVGVPLLQQWAASLSAPTP